MTDLERRLFELGDLLDVPSAPDLATRVTTGLTATPRRRWMPIWAGAGAVGALLVIALVVTPVRSAIADWLGIGGVSVDLATEPLPDPGPVDLDLGRPMSLDAARDAVDFPILVPAGPGEPDQVRLAEAPTGALVYLVYAATDDLPAAPGTGVGMLVTQFRASMVGGTFSKAVPDDASIVEVEVRGAPGLWIDGEMHLIGLLLPDGTLVEDSIRLAANTLLWEEGGITYRIESALDLDAVLAVAAGMRP